MIASVLIELDGVVVDTRLARAEAVAAALGEPTPETVVADDDVSSTVDDFVHAVARARTSDGAPIGAGDETALALAALRAEREYATRIAAGVTLVDGAADAVRTLAAECRLGVVTAWRRNDAERVLAHAGLLEHVRFIAACDDGAGFTTALGRYRHAVARTRRGNTLAVARPVGPRGPSDTVAALVAGRTGFDAARQSGASPVLVGRDVPVRGLTLAGVRTAVDAEFPPRLASVQLLSVPRR